MEQKLPFFKYHPNPLATESFCKGLDFGDEEPTLCNCCGKPSLYWYRGPFYAEEEDLNLCPDCIASGAAAEKYDGDFTAPDHCEYVDDYEKIETICHRTPAFDSIQQGKWLAHCGDFCAFIGYARSWEDLEEQGLAETVTEGLAEKPCRFDLEHIKCCLGGSLDLGYLFRCLHCGKVFMYVDRD